MQAVLDHTWTHLLPALRSQPRPSTRDGLVADRLVDPRLPTAADRVGATPSDLDPADIADGRSTPAPPHGRTLRTLTAVDVTADHLVLHEGDNASIKVPISADWTDLSDSPISASAAVDANGHLIVDLALLATPHRLELTVDPTTRTFDATWPSVPLFGAGIEPSLTRMRLPAD